ncbi:MAG: hypothetical protein P8020_18100 [Acidobacteriota bacterium]
MSNTRRLSRIRAACVLLPGILCCFQAAQLALAQSNSELFLVSGYPSDDTDIKVPTRIYRVLPETKTLGEVLELVPGSEQTAFIRTYQDLRRLIVATPLLPKRLLVVDMDRPCRPRAINLEYSEAFFPQFAYLLDTPDEGLCLDLTTVSLQTRLRAHLDFSLLTGKTVELDAKALASARIPGAAGVGVDNRYAMLVDIDSLGFVKIPWWDEAGDRLIDLGWPALPHAARALMRNDARWPILAKGPLQSMTGGMWWIGTSSLDLISARPESNDKEFTFRVLDKSTGTWRDIKFPGQRRGALTQLKPFGHWLAGVPVGERIENFPRELVDRLRTEGRAADNRYAKLLTFNPRSELFLYDVETEKSYTIETGNVETEVLLIENNQVYYRVKDRLYRSTIREGRVEPPEFLARDPALTGVYWAFVGPACQAAGAQGEK